MGGVYVHAQGYGVCHVYQTAVKTKVGREREGEVIPDIHSSANKPRRPRLCN